MKRKLPDVQVGFRKAEEPEIKLPTSVGLLKKQEKLTTLKPLIVWIITNCGKFLKRREYQTILPVFLETCMRAKKQQLEFYTELTGSGLRKEYDKAVYCHPVYLTYMQRTSWEMPSWMSYKLESRLPGEMSTTSDTWIIPL